MAWMRQNPVRRFLKYNAVGVLGVTLRLAVLALQIGRAHV